MQNPHKCLIFSSKLDVAKSTSQQKAKLASHSEANKSTKKIQNDNSVLTSRKSGSVLF